MIGDGIAGAYLDANLTTATSGNITLGDTASDTMTIVGKLVVRSPDGLSEFVVDPAGTHYMHFSREAPVR